MAILDGYKSSVVDAYQGPLRADRLPGAWMRRSLFEGYDGPLWGAALAAFDLKSSPSAALVRRERTVPTTTTRSLTLGAFVPATAWLDALGAASAWGKTFGSQWQDDRADADRR